MTPRLGKVAAQGGSALSHSGPRLWASRPSLALAWPLYPSACEQCLREREGAREGRGREEDGCGQDAARPPAKRALNNPPSVCFVVRVLQCACCKRGMAGECRSGWITPA